MAPYKVHSYQMTGWDWRGATGIEPGEVKTVYIEFTGGQPWNERDDGGEVSFILNDPKKSTFNIRAKSSYSGMDNKHWVDATLTDVYPPPRATDWAYATFIVTQVGDKYIGSSPPANWMQQTLPLIGDRPLRHVCIPSSHDAGENVHAPPTSFFSSTGNTLTQRDSIRTQLANGVRYFDLRLCQYQSKYQTGHCSYVNSTLGWQGSMGQDFDSIVQQLNSCTASNGELVVLYVSHAMKFDNWERDDVPILTSQEWDSFLTYMQSKVSNLSTKITDTTTDITQMTLNSLIGKGAQVLVIADANEVLWDKWAGKGFIKRSQFYYPEETLQAETVNALVPNQTGYLKQYRTSPDSAIFGVSWVLGLYGVSNVSGPDLIDLADWANYRLADQLWPALSPNTYPNMVTANCPTGVLTAFCIAVNSYWCR